MGGFSFLRVFAVLLKEFTQLTRDRLTYAMILGLPIFQLLLFGYAINNDPRHLPTAVLVQDHSTLSRSVLAAMETSSYIRIVKVTRSQTELDQAIRYGEVLFAVTIPEDFTRRLVRRDHPQILVEADAADPTAGGGALAALAVLPNEALLKDLKGAIARPAAGAPFEVVIHRRYNPENITAFNIVPGLLAIILSITLVMMTALGVTRELERGTMESLLATPVQPLEVMMGKLSPYVVIGLIQATVILTVAKGLFGVPMPQTLAAWAALGVGLMLFIIGSLALGFFFSTLARSQLQAMQMSVFYIMPSILLSGFAFPFQGMPSWAQAIGSFLPATHFLRVVRGAVLKGETFVDLSSSLSALTAFVLGVVALAVLRYRTTLD
jgi:ABC-2 type transport system permease protein